MRLKLTIIAALAAFSLTAADTPKPEPKTDAAPQIQTAKFWRLVAQAQAARQQLNDSPAGKAAQKADEAVQEAQTELSRVCGDKFALGYGPDGDLVCILKPEPPKPAATPKDK